MKPFIMTHNEMRFYLSHSIKGNAYNYQSAVTSEKERRIQPVP